ncbi:hypothetical protein CHS0354_001963 [Potamilus streckersoni]|uniref:Lipoprotein n=1 Tax=Potamilus streckersoni TaxID=2493646 RepID=A0AAE0W7B8_9BIVA|nr:hypothetical protein CHS0354_001963 [Potamilus streckersoni]
MFRIKYIQGILSRYVKKSEYIFLYAVTSVMLLTGCSRYQYAVPGVSAQYIQGQVMPAPGEPADRLLIIAVERQKTFIEFKEKGQLKSERISVVRATPDGRYYYSWNSLAESVTLYMYQPGKLPARYVFNAGIGIGGFEYNRVMAEDRNWKDNARFLVKPFLTGFVVDDHNITDIDRGIISDWLKYTEQPAP